MPIKGCGSGENIAEHARALPEREHPKRLYPRGTSLEDMQDTEPVLEIWRDSNGNMIGRPDPEMQRESNERGDKWVENGKAAEYQRRRREKHRKELRMTEEQFERYSKASRHTTRRCLSRSDSTTVMPGGIWRKDAGSGWLTVIRRVFDRVSVSVSSTVENRAKRTPALRAWQKEREE